MKEVTALDGFINRSVQQRVSFETKNRPYEIKGLRVSKVSLIRMA